MAEKSKEGLAPLEKVLGVSLKGDAEIVTTTEKERRELRIKSIGPVAYDIWSANFTELASHANVELAALEKKVGVKLTEGTTVEVKTSEGQHRVLRIKSIGAASYDIWGGIVEDETKA